MGTMADEPRDQDSGKSGEDSSEQPKSADAAKDVAQSKPALEDVKKSLTSADQVARTKPRLEELSEAKTPDESQRDKDA
jgi:F0F1-type ATP synthase delta subunit